MDWFEFVIAPVLVASGGLVVWFVQSRVEQVRALERTLQEERRKVYADILDPYIRLFANLKDSQAQVDAAQLMLTYEYRKTAFDLNLVGADDVVKAYNAMMQYVYNPGPSGPSPKEMMRLWGALILEIRKSLGNPSKDLDEWDMLRGMITDIESLTG